MLSVEASQRLQSLIPRLGMQSLPQPAATRFMNCARCAAKQPGLCSVQDPARRPVPIEDYAIYSMYRACYIHLKMASALAAQ
jgi:hypothetical protein